MTELRQGPLTIYEDLRLKNSTLLVAWNGDLGEVGPRTARALVHQFGCRRFAEIDPVQFFQLSGVTVEGGVARFPESTFYVCDPLSVAVLISDVPSWEWNDFLGAVLDVAQQWLHVRRILTLGGVASSSAHTHPRQILYVANSPEIARDMDRYNMMGVDNETQQGQRPTMSSYLLWMAQKRGIPAASLWEGVPFYLLSHDDPRALSVITHRLSEILGVAVDTADWDGRADEIDRSFATARASQTDLDEYLGKLENNVGLTQEDTEKLVQEVKKVLQRASGTRFLPSGAADHSNSP
ncbi:MAG: PAC2 family protein [Dehalococcoidia bacterium]|nr:PAC2 family protein [Dehalococcoidia bacterium]